MGQAGTVSGARGDLRPLGHAELERALPILARGFPDRPAGFWRAGIERLRALAPDRAGSTLGHVLTAEGRDVGVLLTLASERVRPDGSAQAVVNLCAWYVDEAHRWRAPLMLRRVLGQGDALHTDLTASPAVRRINAALGFRAWNEGQMLAFLPWTALGRGPDGALLGPDEAGGALAPACRALLARHEAAGCVAAVLCRPGGADPLLFRRTRRRGLPVAHLVYAGSRRAVIAHRGAVARFLLRRGLLGLSVDADRAECPPGTLFRPGRTRYYRGPIERDRVDYACSELVALDLDD